MAQFLIRVELHGAKHGDAAYKILHDEMEKLRFIRTVVGAVDKKTYHLPEAEYLGTTEHAAGIVFSLVASAAGKTGLPAAILVTPSENMLFGGLKEVTAWPPLMPQYPFGPGLSGGLPNLFPGSTK